MIDFFLVIYQIKLDGVNLQAVVLVQLILEDMWYFFISLDFIFASSLSVSMVSSSTAWNFIELLIDPYLSRISTRFVGFLFISVLPNLIYVDFLSVKHR